MGVIKPTLTITANAASATSQAGPASIALALSAKPTGGTVTVTSVKTEIKSVTDTHSIIYTGSTGPAYVYLKNTSDAAIFIGGNADMAAGSRILNLAAGDFAFMPMSDDQDLYADVASGTKTLEVWTFDIS